LINKSWICIAGSSTNSYLSKKVFEIAACGSVPCGNINKQGRTIFGFGSIELTEQMSDYEIIRILSHYLNNKQILRNMSQCNLKTSEKYSYDTFANEIDVLTANILGYDFNHLEYDIQKTNYDTNCGQRVIHMLNDDICCNAMAKFDYNRISHTEQQWNDTCVATFSHHLEVDRLVSVFGMQTFDEEFIVKKRMLHNPCETLILIGFQSPELLQQEYEHLFSQFTRIILVFTEEDVKQYKDEKVDLSLSVLINHTSRINFCFMNSHVQNTMKIIHSIDTPILHFPISTFIQTQTANIIDEDIGHNIACHINANVTKEDFNLIINFANRMPEYTFNIYTTNATMCKHGKLPTNIKISKVLETEVSWFLKHNTCSLNLMEFCTEPMEGIESLILGIPFIYNHDMKYATKVTTNVDDIVDTITRKQIFTEEELNEIQQYYANLYSCRNFVRTINFHSIQLSNPIELVSKINLQTKTLTIKLNKENRYRVYIFGYSSESIKLTVDSAKEVNAVYCGIQPYLTYSYVDFVPKMGNETISLKSNLPNIDWSKIKEFNLMQMDIQI